MRYFFRSIYFVFVGAALHGAAFVVDASEGASDSQPLAILAPEDVIEDYHRFIGARDPLTIEDYSGPHARRDVVELVLVQQALQLGGCERPVKWVPTRLYKNSIVELRSGRHVLNGTSVWERDVVSQAAHLYASDLLLDEGQFVVGFYAAASNRRALSAKSLEDLRELVAASNRHWYPDWKTLNALGFEDMRDVRSWETLVLLLAGERADFTLAPFNASQGMKIEHGDCTLLPIPNLKTSLPGKRVWMVSKKHPEGEVIFGHLQVGLAKLSEQGRVERAYTDCGFLNAAVKDWQLLVPDSE
ncbi:MAG: hypothetical protein ACPGES_00145 [Coraliomargarita sp.]